MLGKHFEKIQCGIRKFRAKDTIKNSIFLVFGIQGRTQDLFDVGELVENLVNNGFKLVDHDILRRTLPGCVSGETILAVAMICGLLSSTVFTLVGLPVWYAAVEDFGAVLAGLLPKARPGRRRAQA